jgi:hypothetical protein
VGSGWQYFVVNCKLPECAVKNYLFPKLFVWKECSEFDNFKKFQVLIFYILGTRKKLSQNEL